jgi:hypothetical protein
VSRINLCLSYLCRSTFFNIDGGRSWISVSTRQGSPLWTFPSVDGGRSRISSSGTSQGVRRQRFLALMSGAPGSLTLAPSRGVAVDIF